MQKNNPVETFLNLPASAKNVCFLHSQHKSILAYNPVAKFSSLNNINDFYKFASQHKDKKIIGFMSYDTAYNLYNIKPQAKNDLHLPNIYFLAFSAWQEFKNPNMDFNLPLKKYSSVNFHPVIKPTQYKQSYQKIKKYIEQGEVYQINLTHRLEGKSDMPARILFANIIKTNPADYLAYIEGDGFEVLSASPERFIKIKNKTIETCPIKGTRPRGKTKAKDLALKKELLASIKEAAELNMITDLLRNDLGQVAKIGSVKLVGHRLISSCPTVWHTYSRIVAKIALNPIQALITMLPGGSITGCPKKRAFEIIDELEPVRRGIYTGVIGHIDPKTQNLDFNIAIRTVIKKKHKLYLQVGGGIVYDSKEKDEWQETLDKAQSFMKILK
ncbi:MAG: anthranilate synthase component I family protein [Patescibacteria group bacterium]